MIKSPSKFLSINFLGMLRKQNYCTDKGQEYCPSEVDLLYFQKQGKLAEHILKRYYYGSQYNRGARVPSKSEQHRPVNVSTSC